MSPGAQISEGCEVENAGVEGLIHLSFAFIYSKALFTLMCIGSIFLKFHSLFGADT